MLPLFSAGWRCIENGSTGLHKSSAAEWVTVDTARTCV